MTGIENSGASYRYKLVSRTQSTAPTWLSAKLGLASDAQVLHLQCMHYSGKRPYQFEDRWICLSAVPKATEYDFLDVGPNEWLIQEVPFTDVELRFSATRATSSLAEFLEGAEGDALFTVERTTWLVDDTVTFARLYFCPGYQMATSL